MSLSRRRIPIRSGPEICNPLDANRSTESILPAIPVRRGSSPCRSAGLLDATKKACPAVGPREEVGEGGYVLRRYGGRREDKQLGRRRGDKHGWPYRDQFRNAQNMVSGYRSMLSPEEVWRRPTGFPGVSFFDGNPDVWSKGAPLTRTRLTDIGIIWVSHHTAPGLLAQVANRPIGRGSAVIGGSIWSLFRRVIPAGPPWCG